VSRAWTDTLLQAKQAKMDMSSRTWDISNLCRSVSLTAARELTRYKLDLVGVQEIRWDRGEQ